MHKELIIITRQFPFGNNETFLESEIFVIAKYFKRIIILPCTNCKTQRKVPDNVVVNNLIYKDYTNSLKWGFSTLISFSFYTKHFKFFFYVRNLNQFLMLIKYCISYTIFLYKSKIIIKNYVNNIVYSYWFKSFLNAFTEVNKGDMKIVTRVHRVDLYEEFSPLGYFPNRKLIIKKIDKIYSISYHGFNYLKEKYNIQNICVSRLGVSTKNLICNRSLQSNFSIVSVSNIIPIKNVILIARSIIYFASKNPHIVIKWNHFGDGLEMINLNHVVNNNSLKNLTIFLNGKVKNSDIYHFYSNSSVDVLINLSFSEGLPVSMMEAISFGIPLIGTNVGAVSEIINSSTGILINNNPSIYIVSSALNDIYLNPPNRNLIFNFWKNNFSANTNYSKFALELIQNL